ncbi:KEOPS complex subunit Cgi121 [Halobaculum sp. D14]|uniref:KEOPS complex subunit Cgi121 n=1 Tax=unclassified Halobaculum TaxID=2640896 RepID=UPI003EB8B2FF
MRLVDGRAVIDDLDAFLGDLDAVADDAGCTVQAFDARYVVGRDHLARAVELADRAFTRGENVARDRGIEITLYAAGRRQINEALDLGVAEGELPVVVLCDGGDEAEAAAEDRVRDLLDDSVDALGDYDEALVREFFDVTATELAATDGDLGDVVLERVALLDVRK